MRCLSCEKWKIQVFSKHEFWLTYEGSRGGFQDLSVLVGKTVGLIFFISGSDLQFSRAVPREPGAQEDQAKRWSEITQTWAAEEGHLCGGLQNPCGTCLWQGRGFLWGHSGSCLVGGCRLHKPSPPLGKAGNGIILGKGNGQVFSHLHVLRRTTYTVCSGIICTLKKP